MSHTVSHLYEFGSFSLDPVQRLLLRQGRPVSVTPKAFDLLVLMVENNGQLLVKEKLMDALWPRVSVEEGNLAVTVSHLRKILGDDRGKHIYIETVSKQGYRFVAQVVEGQEVPLESIDLHPKHVEEEPAAMTPIVYAALPSMLAGWKWMAGPAIALAGLLAMTGWWLASRHVATASANGRPIKSLAVLPFAMIGGAGSDEYLGLGTADALITRLSNTGKILVRPTSAIEKYRSSSISAEGAGKEQQVDAIIDGRIQREGNRVRMTVQMVRVADGAQLWAQAFDEEFTNIFSLEDEVSERVAHSIRLQLNNKEEKRFTKRPTENQEAYSAFVKGRYYWNKRTNEGMMKGLEYFREAIRMDPNFAEAYEGVADSYAALGLYAAIPPQEAFPAARDAANKALRMNEDLADAHATLGLIDFYYDWNGPAAQNEFQRAFDVNPNYAMAHSWNAENLAAMGRFPEALVEARRAVEEDPLSLSVNSNAGWTFCLAGHYEEAIQTLNKAIDIDPSFPRTHFRLGDVYETRGLYDQAITEFTHAVQLSGGDVYYTAGLGHAYAMAGRTREAREILVTLLNKSAHQYVPAFAMAMIYAGLRENGQALNWLEKSSADHSTSMAYVKVDPTLNGLRSDPRFGELLQRVKF
ncbi:tetratricopeptide repeat protein [Tunturibacter empetritectus]|uniref:Tetratricopeptide repeat protein n=1 Tax=Tunturiibacter empetritectus TaxID=3069691 RepID=A0AAU7ZFH3_9BACT